MLECYKRRIRVLCSFAIVLLDLVLAMYFLEFKVFGGKTVYKIYCAEDLLAFTEGIIDRSIPSNTDAIIMAEDTIDMAFVDDWRPIGRFVSALDKWDAKTYEVDEEYSIVYTGTFDGNGKTISNLRYESGKNEEGQYADSGIGFIGCLGKGGKVKNLTLKNVSFAGRNCVGGIVGYAMGCGAGEDTVTIENCRVIKGEGDFEVSRGKNFVGGLVGYCDNNITIINSSNSCKVLGLKSEIGGLLGACYGEVTMIDSFNEGLIKGVRSEIAGLIGYGKKIKMERSHNRAEIEAEEAWYVGGLVGFCSDGIGMKDCSNNNSVKGIRDVGGLIGASHGKTVVNNGKNYAAVYCVNSDVGGILGCCLDMITFKECENTCLIEGKGNGVGGLVGYGGVIWVDNSSNRGEIKALGKGAGGLIGFAENYININKGFNFGNIDGEEEAVGGLIGFCMKWVTVDMSKNDGAVKGKKDNVGGFIGDCNNRVEVKRSENNGFIEGLCNYVGGFLGYGSEEVIVNECVNSGCVEGRKINVGSMVGSGGLKIDITKSINSGSVLIQGKITTSFIGDYSSMLGENISDSYYLDGDVYRLYGYDDITSSPEELVDMFNICLDLDVTKDIKSKIRWVLRKGLKVSILVDV